MSSTQHLLKSLVLLVIVALALIFYTIFRTHSEYQAYATMRVLANCIMAAIQRKAQDMEQSLAEFQSRQRSVVYLYHLLTSDPAEQSDKRLAQVQQIAEQMERFGRQHNLADIALYSRQTLVAFFWQAGPTQMVMGGRLPEEPPEMAWTFAPDTGKHAHPTSRAQHTLRLPGIATHVEHTVTQPHVAFTTSRGQLMFCYDVPVAADVIPDAFYRIHVWLHTLPIAEYAAVSQTDINLFAESRLDTGTLPAFSQLPADWQPDIWLDFPLRLPIGGHALYFGRQQLDRRGYYIGVIRLGQQGALSMSLSRRLELGYMQMLLGAVMIGILLAWCAQFLLLKT